MNEPDRSMVMELAPYGDLKRLLQVHRSAKLTHQPPPELQKQTGLKPQESLLLMDIEEDDLQETHIEVTTKWGAKCYLATSLLSVVGSPLFAFSHYLSVLIPASPNFKGAPPLSNEQLPWKLRWRIMSDVARGMQFLHSFVPPIVHRDLRSPNVFVRPS